MRQVKPPPLCLFSPPGILFPPSPITLPGEGGTWNKKRVNPLRRRRRRRSLRSARRKLFSLCPVLCVEGVALEGGESAPRADWQARAEGGEGWAMEKQKTGEGGRRRTAARRTSPSSTWGTHTGSPTLIASGQKVTGARRDALENPTVRLIRA